MTLPPPASSARIIAPALPVAPSRPSFPLVATIAPVLMSLVLWLVTHSPFALMFAALGPGIAVASLVDARIGVRRRSRAEEARFARELQETRAEIASEHDRERTALARAAPGARSLVNGREPVRWGGAMPTEIRVGLFTRRSGVALDGVAAIRGSDTASQRLRSIRDEAASLTDAPLLVPIGSGIGVAGPPVESAALARAIVVQLLATCSPAQYRVRGDAAWLDALPHPREPGVPGTVELLGERGRIVVATARDPAALPATVETVVRLSGTVATVGEQSFAPEFLSTEEVLEWANRAAEIAREHGLVTGDAVPAVARFSELPATGEPGLNCAIGIGPDGPVFVDLIADGPHAIIGGTTGSGKSELLMTWLVSMTRLRSPAELTMLLFDFKGGSSFGDVVALPHCVGLVTDLDGSTAARAVASLAAELRYRERVLAAASARSIEEVSDLPRLVIVVDEFAAMAADLPELHAAFADLAARGRSLGVHLVLCTQRPSGVVRDAVLANASLRISLRVNNRADSVAVIGTDAAAASAPPGRAWLARAGEPPTELQVAIATREDVAAVGLWSGVTAPRRPWREPLPRRLAHSGVPGEIGLIDRPAEQSQPPLQWDPAADNLLVIGGAGSGRTTLLRAIAHGLPARLIAGDPEALWDAVLSPLADLLLIDDLDLLVARMPGEYQQAVTEQLALLMRANRTRIAITAQRLTGAIQPLGALCGKRILLRMPNRQEHVIAGGSTQTFDPDLPPGAGFYGDARVQIALSDRTPEVVRAASVPFAPRGLTLAVSPRATAFAARLAAAGHTVADKPSAATGIVVTDPDGWHANWAAFSAASKQHAVLFHDCSPAEFRQLSRSRALPPLIADSASTGWLLAPDGRIERVTI